jgi:hypothetical protein
MPRSFAVFLTAVLFVCVARESWAQRYNPYADAQEIVAPVAPDGTIQWGTFFKSAQLQRSYERLWNLGACRGTNRAITEPVENNKLLIDRLPEADYAGLVQAAHGTRAGGVVAFTDKAAGGGDDAFFAQLHPAGVSHLIVTGTVTAGDLRPGMAVRMRAAVDERGRAAEPLRAVTIITPPAEFAAEAVRTGKPESIVATVLSSRAGTLVVRVDAGRVRRLTFSLADDAVVTVDAARLDLVAPGDAIEVKGRLWSGAGSAGAGTIFASHVTVTKRPLARPETREVAAGAGAASGRSVE